MDPRSQVLLRQAPLFGGTILLAGAPSDTLLTELPKAHAWCWMADTYQYLQHIYAARVSVGLAPPELPLDAAVLFLPKSRELTAYLLQALAVRLPGKTLYLVGEKRAGIEAAAKLLAPLGQHCKLDSARHCQLWQCQVEHAPEPRPLQEWQQRFDCNGLSITSLPGVFSHGRLDKGSALLLEHLNGLPVGDWLDFGCGAGILGATLKHDYPQASIFMLDVDGFAIESSRLTLAANGLQAQLIHGSGIQDAPGQLSAIISNPPFHQGVHTHYQATEQLIQQAARHLRPGGVLRMVANSFLKYPSLLEKHLGPCEILAERNGFSIYNVRRN